MFGLRLSDLAIASGGVLLAASFLPWYGQDTGPFVTITGGGSTSADMWQSPSWWVPVLAGIGVAGLWMARRLGRMGGRWLPAVSLAVGLIGVVLIVAQVRQGAPVSSGPADFGWYAYAPSSENAPEFRSGPRAGLVLGLVGLCLHIAAAPAARSRGR